VESKAKNFENKTYIPRSGLEQIISAATTRKIIQEDISLQDEFRHLSEEERQNEPKKFEDLVRCSARRLQALFVSRGFTMKLLKKLLELENDVNHPLGMTILRPFIHRVHSLTISGKLPLMNYKKPSRCFAHGFDETSDRIPEEALPSHTIIPISFDLEKDIRGAGTYSDVSSVKIHPDHHTFKKVHTFVVIVLTSILTNRYRRTGIITFS
jgi:hypothetical protein